MKIPILYDTFTYCFFRFVSKFAISIGYNEVFLIWYNNYI